MEAIKMRETSQRGFSLLLLVIMITVFAGVAIGVVTLLRSRHESYPYQVQSYQAYALAHAGAEFAMRFTRENTDSNGDYATFLQNWITSTGGNVNLGNGAFTLRYVPWVSGSGTNCGNDKLYSRGTCGTASREIELSNLSSNVVQPSGPLINIVGPITVTHYEDPPGCVGAGTPGCYSGSRLSFNICDPVLASLPTTYGVPQGWIQGQYPTSPTSIAATQDGLGKQVRLAGVFVAGPVGRAGWLWDAACHDPVGGGSPWVLCDAARAASGSLSTCTAGTIGKYVAAGRTLPAWDGNISNAPAQSMQIIPVAHSTYSYAHFPTSGNIGVSNDRPRTGVPCDNNCNTCCDPDPTTCGTIADWCPTGCVFPSVDPLCGTWPHPPCCTIVPCCTGSYPPNPCCYAPGGFDGLWAPGGPGNPRSWAAGTCIDPQRAPSSALYSGNPWVDRTDYTCSERDFAGNQGHVFVVMFAGGGYINIETIGDITPPVKLYFRFPYNPPDAYCYRYGPGGGPPCRPLSPPQYVTWVISVN
jgi:hypothetical protein